MQLTVKGNSCPTHATTLTSHKSLGEGCLASCPGPIRWWDFEQIDQADTFDDQPVCFLEPLRELRVAEGCVIRGLAMGPETWVVQDGRGAFWALPAIDFERDIRPAPLCPGLLERALPVLPFQS